MNNNNNNWIGKNNLPVNPKSEYIHVWKEKEHGEYSAYRISPRRGPNFSFLEAPVTSIADFIKRIIALIFTVVLYIVLFGIALKIFGVVAGGLSNFWINNEDGVWSVVDKLFNLF